MNYSQNPENISLSWWFPTVFLWSIHPKPNGCIFFLPVFPGLVCYWKQALFCHQLFSLLHVVHFLFLQRVATSIRCASSSPSSGTYVFLVLLIDGMLMGGYVLSETSVVTSTQCSITQSSIPSEQPWQNTIYHLLTLFSLFCFS